MPTPITKTVKTSGGDYTTLAAAIAGELVSRADLVSADENLIIEYYNSTTEVGVDLDGFTTDATRNIRITVPSASRHDGTPGTGAKLTGTNTDNFVLRISDDNVTLEYLEIDNAYTGANFQYTCRVNASSVVVHGCIITNGGGGTNMAGLDAGGTGNIRVSCNLVLDQTWTGIICNSSTTKSLYNNVVKDCAIGYDFTSAAHVATNNIAYGNTTSWANDASVTGTNNAADDQSTDTPPGSSPVTTDLVSGDFDAAATDDMRPLDTGTPHEAGADLSGTFTTDIVGDTFPATWNVGAFATSTVSDSTAPSLSAGTVTQVTGKPTEVNVGFTSDEAGTYYIMFSANASETGADVKSGQIATGSATASSQTVSNVAGWSPGTALYAHVAVEDAATNIQTTALAIGPLTTNHFAGSQTLTITTVPADSILYYYGGTHTPAGTSTTILTDANANGGSGWTDDELIGVIVKNRTDGEAETITDNDGTTATHGAFSTAQWDQGDAYDMYADVATSDVLYFESTTTVSSESANVKYYTYDDSAAIYSAVATATITATGAVDGTYSVTADAEGVITLTKRNLGSKGKILNFGTLLNR